MKLTVDQKHEGRGSDVYETHKTTQRLALSDVWMTMAAFESNSEYSADFGMAALTVMPAVGNDPQSIEVMPVGADMVRVAIRTTTHIDKESVMVDLTLPRVLWERVAK